MAIANKCDRCGKLFECKDGYLDTPIAFAGRKNRYDIPKIVVFGIENSTRSDYAINSAELCYECYEEFRVWYREKGVMTDG